MICGTGVDIVKIERIEHLLGNPAFLDRLFTKDEQAQFENIASHMRKCEKVAGSFAAKEAYSKAVGTGFVGFSPRDIQVLRDETGKPHIVPAPIHDDGRVFHLSISHEKDYAIAFVVCEGGK